MASSDRKAISTEWANSAVSSEIEEPTTTKQNNGWEAEKPPYQNFNWFWQTVTNMLRHSERNGIMRYKSTTEYTLGGLCLGSDSVVYKSLVASNLGKDPLTDTTSSWRSVNSSEYLHVRDEKTSGTNGGNLVIGWNDRILNTVKTNTISGASLSSNEITLPVGTYRVKSNQSIYQLTGAALGGQAQIVSTSGNSIKLYGLVVTDGAGYGCPSPTITGQFSLTQSTALKLQLFSRSNVTNGIGFASSSGNPEVYAEVEIWKVG